MVPDHLIIGPKPVAIPISRLRKHCDPFENSPWEVEGITPALVCSAAILNEVYSQPIQPREADIQKHIQRIAYFLLHGWDDPICIDVGVPGFPGYRASWLVTDGNHRLAAAIIRGDEIIKAWVDGSIDYAEELFGVVIA